MNFTCTLDQLCLSPFNVRRNAEDAEATGALENSIAARGLLFPLILHDMAPYREEALPGEPVTAWGVLAGGRRLRALRRLAAAGRIPAGYPVPTLVFDGDRAAITELSLSENLLRRELRHYEIHAAVRDAADRGATEEEIAENIGQRIEWVRRELRLGRLIPEIFDAYAAGTLAPEQAQAFAATEDHDLQRAAWAHFGPMKDWDRQPHRIRAWYKVGDHELEKLLRFVGADAYRQAGGRFELDLFADGPERGRVVDEGKLRELVEAKLAGLRTDLRKRTGRADLRFAAEPPQQHGATDWSLAAEVKFGKADRIILPKGDIFVTVNVENDGCVHINYWWASRKARRDALRETSAAPDADAPAPAAPPRTRSGDEITGAEAFNKYSTYAQTARAAVKDEHGLTADGLQVLRSLRREVLRALMLTDAMGGGAIGRDYFIWAQLRQELDRSGTRAADLGMRGLYSPWNGGEDSEPEDVVAPHLEQTRAHEMWSATLDHLKSLPFITLEDPAQAFAAFYFESEKVKNTAAAVLAGLALMRSANVPGWRVAVHDRVAEIIGADDGVIRELWSPTPTFMALFPKLKRLELAQPYVEPEAFRTWHRNSDQVLTGACAGALEQAPGWVYPLLSFNVGDTVPTTPSEVEGPGNGEGDQPQAGGGAPAQDPDAEDEDDVLPEAAE